MFYASKLTQFILLPSNLLAIIGLLGLVALIAKRRRLGVVLLGVSTALLLAGGWSPVGPALLVVLEDRFSPPSINGPVDGIVLLGGAVNTHITAERGQPALNDAGERLTAVASLARKYPAARLVLSGGASHLVSDEPVTESAVARDLLVQLGIEPSRIEMEERSRDTCENAEQSRLIARPRAGERWLLVTSASHMPRAMACFRAVGFPIVAFPVDFRTRGPADLWRPPSSAADGLEALDLAAHEWLGLAMYRLFGRTKELLPTP